MKNVVAGVDVGGTYTKFGLVDRKGKVYGSGSIPTDTHKDVELYLDELCTALRKLLTKSGGKVELKGIGIGAPNANYYSGAIEFAPNLKWRGVIPLSGLIGSRMGVPVAITNDANAAALGEMMYGDGPRKRNRGQRRGGVRARRFCRGTGTRNRR
jgi:glucokinase